MNAQEIRETDGGLIGVAIFFCVVIIAGPILAWQSGHTVVGQPNGAS